MSLNTRFKMAVLAASLLVAGNVSAFPVVQAFKKLSLSQQIAISGFTVGVIRLWTKGGAWDYKMSDWKNDLKGLMEEHNIFDVKLYKNIVAMIDKYIIGRRVSIIDATTRSKNENGEIVAMKRKRCDVKPFGLLGLFDAYVLMQLEKIGEIAKGLDTANNFFTLFVDTPTVVGDNNIIIVKS